MYARLSFLEKTRNKTNITMTKVYGQGHKQDQYYITITKVHEQMKSENTKAEDHEPNSIHKHETQMRKKLLECEIRFY